MVNSYAVLLLGLVQFTHTVFCSSPFSRALFSRERYRRDTWGFNVQSDGANGVPSCGGYITNEGYIRTERYPRSHRANSYCEWHVHGPEKSTVILTVKDFLLEKSDEACSSDYLIVYDGKNKAANPIGRYCGVDVPKTIESTKNDLFLVFQSDDRVNKRGFEIFVNFTGDFEPLPTVDTKTEPVIVPLSWERHLPNATTIEVEQKLVLMCLVNGEPPPTISWKKNGEDVESIRGRIHIKSDKRVSHLRIPETTFGDTGVYGCVAENGIGKPLASFGYVKVEGAPKIRDGPQSQTIDMGQSVTLKCKVEGSPEPTIRWKVGNRDKTDKAQSSGSRSLLTISPRSTTNVRCIAQNTYGEVESEDARVSVLGKPFIRKEPPESHFVLNNHTIVLKCKARGTPKPNFSWSKGGLDVTPLSSTKGTTSTLTVLVTDNVKVVCHASNRFGSDKAEYKLTVVGPPNIDKKLSFKNQTVSPGSQVTLSCYTKGVPETHFKWFVNGTDKTGQSVEHGSVSNLTIDIQKTVVVTCVARSAFGPANHSAVISVMANTASILQEPTSLNIILVAAIIGSLVGLALVAMVVMCYCKNRRQTRSSKLGLTSGSNVMELTSNPMFHKPPQVSNLYISQELQHLEYPRNSIEFIQDIENGNFSRLFLGRARNLVKGEEATLIQVKVLKDGTQVENFEHNFEKEAVMLAKLNHPNVCRLVGVCMMGRPLCLIFQHQDRGDLHQFLRDCGCSNYNMRQRSPSRSDAQLKLTNIDQLHIAKQIAAGMTFLTSKGYIHRELTTKCCFIDHNLVVKIGNIGLNWAVPMINYYRHNPVGRSRFPVRWLPPETIMYGLYTEETDVWSFGVVMWEIYSYSLLPYYGMNNDEIISYVREGDVLPCPKDCPEEVYEIMRECWHLLGSERPSFRVIYDRISALNTGIAV